MTFANNKAEAGAGIFSAAIAGQMNFQIHNSIFWNNTTKDAGSPMACGFTSAQGSNNLQWPQKKVVGGANDNACVAGITFADANLGPLAAGGGPTLTTQPAAGSPAFGAGADCPPTDQRGEPRKAACTLGAVE
ncbi:MAG: polymorphic outer membrane protein [Labilithrix sp.]|nr:polymorphic outer membrane protein [Labilithrix sp.]